MVLSLAGVVLWSAAGGVAQPSPDSAAGKLAAMRDKARPLLVFYPQAPGERPLEARMELQRKLLEGHAAALRERDVVMIDVPLLSADEGISQRSWTGFRRMFHVADASFTVVLVGKDGGEKFRSHVPVTIEKLESVIDAMPMRQQEMRDGHPE